MLHTLPSRHTFPSTLLALSPKPKRQTAPFLAKSAFIQTEKSLPPRHPYCVLGLTAICRYVRYLSDHKLTEAVPADVTPVDGKAA